ncbi:MAG: FAD-binding oxidoreductase [Alcanivorax sp.]
MDFISPSDYYVGMNTHDLNIFQGWLGDNGVLTDEKDMAPYVHGWRGDKGKAAAVLRPRDTETVSKIISYCARKKIHIIPQSGNTGLVAASSPDESGTQVVLTLERMNNIHKIDTINGSIHVEAGVRLSALNEALEEYHLCFPIDLSADPCIGGMIATNTGGSRFLKYRGVREHVMGVKAVLADKQGTVIDTMIPLHKNNTGLDTKQLFIGTNGIFGVITEAVLRLSPAPAQMATAILIPHKIEDINALLTTLEKKCGVYLSAFEGMSGNAMKAALAHTPSIQSPFGQDPVPDYAILLELTRDWPKREKEQSLDDVLESILEEIWEESSAPLENAIIGPPEKLWPFRHALSEGVQKSGALYAFDLSFTRGKVAEFLRYMEDALAEEYPELTICDFGHIGDGAVHFNLVAQKKTSKTKVHGYEEALRAWVTEIAVTKFGGSYSAEHGLGRKNQAFYDKYTPADVKEITRVIKGAIAPIETGVVKV